MKAFLFALSFLCLTMNLSYADCPKEFSAPFRLNMLSPPAKDEAAAENAAKKMLSEFGCEGFQSAGKTIYEDLSRSVTSRPLTAQGGYHVLLNSKSCCNPVYSSKAKRMTCPKDFVYLPFESPENNKKWFGDGGVCIYLKYEIGIHNSKKNSVIKP